MVAIEDRAYLFARAERIRRAIGDDDLWSVKTAGWFRQVTGVDLPGLFDPDFDGALLRWRKAWHKARAEQYGRTIG